MKISDSTPKWVTREYIQACNDRDHFYRIYAKDKTDANRVVMKRTRNYATKLKNYLKRDYSKNAITDIRGNSKGLWRAINDAFGKAIETRPHP